MSGPFFIDISGDILGGPPVGRLMIDGNEGDMALYVPGTVDSRVFKLFMGSKLNLKEKVCGIKQAPPPKGNKVQDLVPVCSKVSP